LTTRQNYLYSPSSTSGEPKYTRSLFWEFHQQCNINQNSIMSGTVTRMLLVVVPEWGHLSPFLHVADSIKRYWDPSKGGAGEAISQEAVELICFEQQQCP
jgi:hypothetical protein